MSKYMLDLPPTNVLTPILDDANIALDGVQSATGFTVFTVTTAATNSSGLITIVGNDRVPNQTYSMTYTSVILPRQEFTFHCGWKYITFVNRSGETISSADGLATYLAGAYPEGFVIGWRTEDKLDALELLLGGVDGGLTGVNTSIHGRAKNFHSNLDSVATLIGNPTGSSGDSVSTRLGNPLKNGVASDMTTILGGDTGAGVTISTLLGDPGNNTILGNVGGSTTSIQSGLNALSTVLAGNTNFAAPLYSQLNTVNSNLDNSLNSLPGGASYATVAVAATNDGLGGVNMTFAGGLIGTYSIAGNTINNGIINNSPITLTNGINSLVLYNRSGSNIMSQIQLITYLQSMYPVGSKISLNVMDRVASLSTMVGGNATSLRARLGSLDRQILKNATGVLTSDLATARGMIVPVLNATLEADVMSVNLALDGSQSGVILSKVGSPVVNGVQSNIFSVLGGEGTSIAEKLGDPVLGDVGLSSLVNTANVNNNAGLFASTDNLSQATNVTAQLQEFLNLFNPNNWANNGHTQIVFDVSGGPPTSLADLINRVSSTL